MIYSILQLISALTLVTNPSSISTLSNEGNITLPMQGVYSSIDNIGDDLKVMYYYGDIQPLSNDFLNNEWEKGINLNNGFLIRSGITPQWSYLIKSSNSGFQFESNKTYSISFYCENYSNYGLYLDNSLFNGKVDTIYFELGNNATYSNNILFGNFTFNQSVYLPSNADFISSSMPDNDFNASDLMITTLGYYYPYQQYHSDSELFDVQYDEIAFAFDLEELDTATSYQDYIDFWVSFSFASRVQYDGSEYTYSLRDLYFGFSRRDYDQPYPLFPTLNYYIYSSYNFSIDSLPANVRYTSSKIPLIYSSTDSYESLHHSIEGVINFSSYDVLEFSLCFEYIDPTLMSYMVGGVYDLDYREGFNNGKDVGYQNGVEDGKKIGYDTGYDVGKEDGKQIGIAEGREQVIETGQTASIIFNGIISVGLLPTNVFLQMLNLEVFGINIGALVSSLLTIMIIIIIGRMLFGGKNEV